MKNRKKTQNNVGKYEYLTRKRERWIQPLQKRRDKKKNKKPTKP